MKAAIDRHFVQNRTKFDAEMMKYYRLVLQLPTVPVFDAVRWIMTIIYVTDTK